MGPGRGPSCEAPRSGRSWVKLGENVRRPERGLTELRVSGTFTASTRCVRVPTAMPSQPPTDTPKIDDFALDLSRFTRKERELLVGLASSLISSRERSSEAADPVFRLWCSYAAKPPAVEDEDEAERIALEAVAEARGRL